MNMPSEPQLNRRIGITFFFFLFAFGVVIVKAFKVQVFDREELIKRSHRQVLRESTVYPKRGHIYDRNGNALAVNVQTYSIFTIPKNNSKKTVYRKLSRIVPNLKYKSLLQKIKNRKRYTWLARKIKLNKEQVAQIKKLKGVYIEAVPKRFYPNHELLAQVLGFVGVDNVGLAGVEYYFDKSLRGKPLLTKYIKDAKGRAIKFESDLGNQQAEDIHLTIDKDIQAIAEKSLKEAVLKFQAKGGGVGVLDAKTGEVLAVANYPTFDPNSPNQGNSEAHKLAFISDPIEPGSVFKSFTVASAIEHNVAKVDTSYYCERGQFKVDDHIISEAESDKRFEWLTVSDILRFSSNIGTTKIAFDLTYPRLRETLDKFGVGKKTDIRITWRIKRHCTSR